MNRPRTLSLLAALAAVMVAMPVAAYTIFFKDGSKIEAKEKPRIQGELVIITLLSDTETSYPAAEVDFERTQEFNEKHFDGAIAITEGEAGGVPLDVPTKRQTLQDEKRELTVREEQKRDDTAATAAPVRNADGSVDLDTLRREAYNDLEIVTELRSYFTSQGLEAHVFSGTASGRPMIEVVTSSESAVFKSLEVAAQALPQLRDRHPSRIHALELLLKTSGGGAAGQFLMTPELAASLNSGDVDIPTFFIRHVRF
jgi:hypothetical protein